MLDVSGLSAGYGQIEVLHGLTFTVPKGQVVTLIGSNGAGKTTTMRALSGMIKPRAGSIKLNGREIGGLESHDVARTGLAHSPEGRRVFPTLSVEDNLTLGAFPRLTGSRPKGDVNADRADRGKRARRGADEIADAADVDHDIVDAGRIEPALEVCDHAVTLARRAMPWAEAR